MPKTQDRQKVFNLAVPKRTKAALLGIFIFQIFNFILLWLYPLSTAVSSLVIYLRNNPLNILPECRIRANCLDIEFDLTQPASQNPQKLKLYSMATVPQKI